MLTVVEDTTEGIHDTMIAACDRQRYEELGGGSEHRNCADNLVEGLGGISMPFLVLLLSLARAALRPFLLFETECGIWRWR